MGLSVISGCIDPTIIRHRLNDYYSLYIMNNEQVNLLIRQMGSGPLTALQGYSRPQTGRSDHLSFNDLQATVACPNK